MTIHLDEYGMMKSSFQLYLFIKDPIPTLLVMISVFFFGRGGGGIIFCEICVSTTDFCIFRNIKTFNFNRLFNMLL